ncbi:MAG: hypothetical protein CBC13_06450 [Planctomycetia bacterium TMED53]|nr:MAG: hypothetical protein CBC13_06450 [Planctomycetia bacterium TMED53]
MTDHSHWHGRTLLLGVTGGVAAYKVADLASRWTQRGAKVRVRMTPSACKFVQPLTFEAVTRQPVTTEIWQPLGTGDRPEHIGSGDEADLFIIAPASADHLARLAQGFGDDAVCLTALAWEGPLVICPAMNDRMWRHAAVQANINTLRERGAEIIDPGVGHLACGSVGPGRLADLDVIDGRVDQILGARELS